MTPPTFEILVPAQPSISSAHPFFLRRRSLSFSLYDASLPGFCESMKHVHMVERGRKGDLRIPGPAASGINSILLGGRAGVADLTPSVSGHAVP